MTAWQKLTESVSHAPGQGYGIRTDGEIWIFDVDKKKNGLENFQKLLDAHPDEPWPVTYTVATPGGGFHAYFLKPEGVIYRSIGKLAPGIDILGKNSFAIGAGSPHANGGEYRVKIDADVTNAPKWLLAWIAEHPTGEYGNVAAEAWEPVSREDPTYLARVAEQVSFFKRSPLFEEGGGKHRYVLLLQNAGPGLLLDEETTLLNYREHYDARLAPKDRWFPDHEAQFRGEIMRRAWAVTMDRGRRPDGLWLEHQTLLGLRKEPAETAETFRPGINARQDGDVKLQKMSLAEVTHVLRTNPVWKNVLRLDSASYRILSVGSPIEGMAGEVKSVDVSNVRMWFESMGRAVSKDTCQEAIESVAYTNRFNPIVDFIDSLPVGDPKGLDSFAKDFFGAETDVENELLKRMASGLIARGLKPGIKNDIMFILAGQQGFKKSSWLAKLGGEFYSDNPPSDLETKDACDFLQGKWIVEFGELRHTKRTNTETIKGFLSKTEDEFRRAYEKDIIKRPRQCVLCGSTNDHKFLTDATGDRRFSIITVNKILDIAGFDRMRFLSDAKALYLSGQKWWVEEDEAFSEQLNAFREEYREGHPWLKDVQTIIAGMGDWVDPDDVLAKLLRTPDAGKAGIPGAGKVTEKTKENRRAVIDCLLLLKCRFMTRTVNQGGSGKKEWRKPDKPGGLRLAG